MRDSTVTTIKSGILYARLYCNYNKKCFLICDTIVTIIKVVSYMRDSTVTTIRVVSYIRDSTVTTIKSIIHRLTGA